MRKIRKIIVHCSDSDIPDHDDISVIDKWHKARGWAGVGYHYFIKSDGTVQDGRPDDVIGAHVSGHNHDSLGICLHGRHNFTEAQFFSLKALLYDLMTRYDLRTTDIYGHRDFDSKKTCPNFDVKRI